jgi:hypothetical protein
MGMRTDLHVPSPGAARRIELDLTLDQRHALQTGLTIRTTGSTGSEPWSATIDGVAEIERDESTIGPTMAILTREAIPASIAGEQAWEVVFDSTDGPVLSASPAAVHMSDDGEPFVVVLDGSDETVTPVRVGLVTNSRLEIIPLIYGALEAGDPLVLNPDR